MTSQMQDFIINLTSSIPLKAYTVPLLSSAACRPYITANDTQAQIEMFWHFSQRKVTALLKITNSVLSSAVSCDKNEFNN